VFGPTACCEANVLDVGMTLGSEDLACSSAFLAVN